MRGRAKIANTREWLRILCACLVAGCSHAPCWPPDPSLFSAKFSNCVEPRTSGTQSESAANRDTADYLKKDIRTVIDSHIHEIRWCYESALHAWNASGSGTVRVRFEIRPSGTVGRVAVEENQLGMSSLGCCIAARVETWSFAQFPTPGTVIVSYPFVFRYEPSFSSWLSHGV